MSKDLHLMIDLETLGVRSDARIIELGAAVFDINGDGVESAFSIALDVGTQGGSIDAGTVDFWLKQPDAARMNLAKAKKMKATEALDQFEKDLSPWGQFKGLWSHGPAFDVAILSSLYNRVGRGVPWGHKTIRDTRTLKFAVEQVGLKPMEYPTLGTMHTAADDCISQAKWVQGLVKQLRSMDPL